MKHSIAKIFKNLHTYLFLTVVLLFITLLFVVEQHYSYEKLQSLNSQKKLIQTIFQKQKVSNQLEIILYNNNIANINHALEKMQNQHNFISMYFFNNSQTKDLNELKNSIRNFDTSSRKYFSLDTNDKELKIILNTLDKQYEQIASSIDAIALKSALYDKGRFFIFSNILLLSFLVLFSIMLWYKKRLSRVYKDINYLQSSQGDTNLNLFSQEAISILSRIKRKTQISDNPALIDPVTEIYNNKGMVQAYAERKGIKDNSFSSITILEVDNFSKSKRTFSQEFTQTILKKVAYTISLHQQSTDVIARSDYNQFTIIFSRPSKEQLFQHTDIIRQSISEIKLLDPNKEQITITVTGGFINKTNNAPLDESIRKTKDLLQKARHIGKNRVFQTKDIPK